MPPAPRVSAKQAISPARRSAPEGALEPERTRCRLCDLPAGDLPAGITDVLPSHARRVPGLQIRRRATSHEPGSDERSKPLVETLHVSAYGATASGWDQTSTR